jgi:hypothetical protein
MVNVSDLLVFIGKHYIVCLTGKNGVPGHYRLHSDLARLTIDANYRRT